MKVAIIYDRVNKWGGAERVLLVLHELFPDAPLYTSVYDEKRAPWAKEFPEVISSFLQKIPCANSRHELLAPLMPLAFESFNFDKYDLVISVTSEAAKGVITKPHTRHISYCLTPTRYLWSHYGAYFTGASFKVVTKSVVSYLRTWDKIAAQRPDKIISISTAVKERVWKYYKRDSDVIFPPVEIEKFQIPNSKIHNYEQERYYLVVSRLVPYKRVDLAIEAFNDLGVPLVIIGSGSEEKKLKKIAKDNIRFTGCVKDEDLPSYYQGAKAFIMPQEEDFGIAAVEAQAAGVPVIANKAGGALDTIIDEKTGIFFEKQTKESLIEAVRRTDDSNHQYRPEDCISNAQRFSKERFKKEFIKLVEKYY